MNISKTFETESQTKKTKSLKPGGKTQWANHTEKKNIFCFFFNISNVLIDTKNYGNTNFSRWALRTTCAWYLSFPSIMPISDFNGSKTHRLLLGPPYMTQPSVPTAILDTRNQLGEGNKIVSSIIKSLLKVTNGSQ